MDDTERLNWLEKMGNGIGLIHDDDSHWAVGSDGIQNVSLEEGPYDLCTSFYIEKHMFKPTIREAIDYAREQREAEVQESNDTTIS